MVKRNLLGLFALLFPAVCMQAQLTDGTKLANKKKDKMERAVSALPDSAYERVKKEDLLNDEVYMKLARDGWYPQEITRIMDRYINSNRSKVRGSREYGMYAKQWLPIYGHTPGNDTIYQFVDTAYYGETMKSVRSLFASQLENYYPEIPYTPDDRMKGIRNKGYFRPVYQKPYTGRVHWIVVHPTDPDALMVVPDGGGIFRTADLGKTWDCVTDRIPDREFRKICSHSAIPVDPDDWNHFFAFMKNGGSTAVYETTDGGQSWTRVQGATHKEFKRGYGFKDKAGNLKFIGANQGGSNYLDSKVWYSDNKGVTWKQVVLPDSLKEVHPTTGMKGSFFQNFAFDPEDRDKIYFTTSRSIYYSEDGLTPQVGANGATTFNIKRLTFDVYNQDGTVLRASNVNEFPFKATTQSFLEINPNNPKQMWFATASRNVSYGVYSAVYRSDDGGKTWRTLQEPMNGIGSGLAFGNESPWGWLGGFGVNFADPQWLYGCSMSSAISSDGGFNFREFGWGNRLKALHDDGQYYTTTSARHNADNHCIVSHRSGRVFRGSDAGLLMKDKNINNNEWTNINGTMGNQLHYSIKVNEFGDQTMLGNTQDVDAQTYRYGRWGNWRGYEGTEAFINPYAGTCYFSGSGGGGLENVSLSSWYEGYSWADVFTGNWYLIHNPGNSNMSFFRIEDFGRKTVNLSAKTVDVSGAGAGARDMALARDGDRSTIFVLNTNHTIMRSTNGGDTFETVYVKGSDGSKVVAKFTNAWFTVDPDNSNIIYIGQTGKVLKYDLAKGDSEDLSAGLPNVSCEDIFFHEGSGDIYFFSKSSGIYLRDHSTGQWTLWMKGYNPLSASRLALNYTTQEMVIGDYGRGVWVADLEHPSDRYFKNGFALKELSNVDGRRTFGIDTKWTIPLYYDYTWYVNGQDVNNPYQYLTAQLNDGDKVKRKLTWRESPDVSTTSAEYTVKSSASKIAYEPKPGTALYSDGSGRVDLGYVDWFFNDFTIEFWIKPESNGVVLCNRPVEQQRDTRGWALLLDQGKIKFRYAPAQLFDRATYDANETQQSDVVGTALTMGRWSHVALSHDRDGNVVLYVNGNQVASSARIVQWAPLNSAVYLSLFADGFESMAMKGAVDELKIWNSALNANDIRRAMFSHDTSMPQSFVYCNDFNAGSLDKEHELFSRGGMAPRVQAVTSYVKMPVAVAAVKSEVKTPSERTAYDFGDGRSVYLTPADGQMPEIGVYRYAHLHPDSMGVNSLYYKAVSEVFQIRPFSDSENASVDIEIPLALDASKQYQLYACGLYEENKVWQKVSDLSISSDGKYLVARGVKLDRLSDKMLAVLENKPAIEASLEGGAEGNEIYVYDAEQTNYSIDAHLVGGMSEPTGLYEVKSKTGLFKIADNMKFVNGKATAKLVLDLDKLNGADALADTIVGKADEKLVPLAIKVNNRLLPTVSGRDMTFQNGGAYVSSSKITGGLNGKTTVTMMGWVRIDNTDMLSGVKPLIFFRGSNSGVCGIHLASGNLRFHWNDGYYGWSTTLNFTTADIGRWMHVALVVEPTQFRVYLNGAEYSRGHDKITGGIINSALMFGQNYQSDKWFNGAVDQVMLWNRSLTAEEIRRYMTVNPRLDDPSLVSFIDMDHVNADGKIYDLVSEAPLATSGVTSNDDYSHMPFHPSNSFTQNSQAPAVDNIIFVEPPSNVNADYTMGVFNGTPYNYANSEHSNLTPLYGAYFTLTMSKPSVFSSGQKAVIGFNMPQTAVSSGAVLAIRPIGSPEPFSTYQPMTSLVDGKMRFEVDGTLLNGGSELMLMYDGTQGELPVKVNLSVNNYNEGDTLILNSETDRITVKADVVSANPQSKALVSVVESEYASADVSELDLSGSAEKSFVITINKDNLNKLAVNPVTVTLSGVSEGGELKLNVALEPIVELSLADNDSEDNSIVVEDPYASFGVKAKLVQGVLAGGVKIKTTADMPNIVNTAVGSMLSNNDVAYTDILEYYPSASEFDAGWNLIGNPYLSNINLTKEQNVSLHEDEVVKYLYQYNPESDTYTAWDMVENYDETQKLMPFQPFFVQTRQTGASLVIKPESKSTTINRRVFDHYMLHESRMLRLGLYAGDSDKLSDRTEIKIQEGTSTDIVFGEDAVKMWGGLNSKTNEMATVAGDRYLSVNVLPNKRVEIPLHLQLSAPGKYRIASISSYGYGLNDNAELVDKATGARWKLLDGEAYEFNVADVKEAASRFIVWISIREDMTGVEDAAEAKPSVSVESGACRIDGLSGKSVIEIFDTAGRRIVYTTVTSASSTHNLTAGTYIVRVRTSNKDFSNKINVR